MATSQHSGRSHAPSNGAGNGAGLEPKPGAARGAKRSFVLEYLKNPSQIGAVSPSGRFLARAMLETVDFKRAQVIAEYGPGAGAFTTHILARLDPSTVFVPIELNPKMADIFRRRFPGVRLHERSVAELPAICRELGLGDESCVDYIVSGLPWAVFPESLQREILEATRRMLRPGGMMMTFSYNLSLLTRAGKRFAKLAPDYFARVERSPTVLRNLPPAFVYRCVK